MLRPTLLLPHASHMCLLHSTSSISRQDSTLLLYTASACNPASASHSSEQQGWVSCHNSSMSLCGL